MMELLKRDPWGYDSEMKDGELGENKTEDNETEEQVPVIEDVPTVISGTVIVRQFANSYLKIAILNIIIPHLTVPSHWRVYRQSKGVCL